MRVISGNEVLIEGVHLMIESTDKDFAYFSTIPLNPLKKFDKSHVKINSKSTIEFEVPPCGRSAAKYVDGYAYFSDFASQNFVRLKLRDIPKSCV